MLLQRPIVEFAVEDVRIMRVRDQRKKRLASKNSITGRHQEDPISGEGESVRGTNKKVNWQLKCKEKRLRRREARKQSVDTGSNTSRDGGQQNKVGSQRNTGSVVSGTDYIVRGSGLCGVGKMHEERRECRGRLDGREGKVGVVCLV